jgi:hypothetical protein
MGGDGSVALFALRPYPLDWDYWQNAEQDEGFFSGRSVLWLGEIPRPDSLGLGWLVRR